MYAMHSAFNRIKKRILYFLSQSEKYTNYMYNAAFQIKDSSYKLTASPCSLKNAFSRNASNSSLSDVIGYIRNKCSTNIPCFKQCLY